MSLFQACSNRFRTLFEQQAKSSRHLSPRSEGCFVRKCLTIVIEFVIPVIVPAAVSACNLINSHTLTPTEFGSGSNSFLKFVLSENRKRTYVKDLLKVKFGPTYPNLVQHGPNSRCRHGTEWNLNFVLELCCLPETEEHQICDRPGG